MVPERFTKTLKGNIFKRITVNDSKFYLRCLNKLVNEHDNIYRGFIGTCSALTEVIETNLKTPKHKVSDRVKNFKYKYSKVTSKIGWGKYFWYCLEN